MIVTSQMIDQYQILRTAAEIMRKTRRYEPSNLGICALYRIARSIVYAAFCASTLLVGSLESSAEIYQADCGTMKESSLQLDETCERMPVQHPSVLCTFRRKSGGFPTATVAWESRVSAKEIDSDAARVESIVQSYHRVGLTDARITEARTVTEDGRKTFLAVVSYSTLGTPMMGIIAVVDGGRRTFTLTVLDTAESFPISKPRLEALAHTFRITDPTDAGPHNTRAPLSPATWAALVFVALLGVVLVAYLTTRAFRR